MRFNFWLVVLLALGPIFILIAGLTAVAGYASPVGWEVMGIVAAAALVVAHLARQSADEDGAEAADEAAPLEASHTRERRDEAAASGLTSPARQPDGVEPASCPGYASREEVLTLLDQLLEAERAGARGVREMSAMADNAQTREALQGVAKDEARFCAMLFAHITRLGGMPSRRTGPFHEKLAALETVDDRLELLNRGQGWVVRKLADALPTIVEPALRADLQAMLDAHVRNIASCTRLIQSPEAVAAG
jgi:hypothetical protein